MIPEWISLPAELRNVTAERFFHRTDEGSDKHAVTVIEENFSDSRWVYAPRSIARHRLSSWGHAPMPRCRIARQISHGHLMTTAYLGDLSAKSLRFFSRLSLWSGKRSPGFVEHKCAPLHVHPVEYLGTHHQTIRAEGELLRDPLPSPPDLGEIDDRHLLRAGIPQDSIDREVQ